MTDRPLAADIISRAVVAAEQPPRMAPDRHATLVKLQAVLGELRRVLTGVNAEDYPDEAGAVIETLQDRI